MIVHGNKYGTDADECNISYPLIELVRFVDKVARCELP